MAADGPGRWEEVRRALGRLFGRVSSHSLPEAQAGIGATVRHSADTWFPAPIMRQADWQPAATVWGLPAPAAAAGGGGADPASVVTIVGADRALGAGSAIVASAPCRFVDVPLHAWTLAGDTLGDSALHGGPVFLGGAAVRTSRVRVIPPSVRASSMMRLALPKPNAEHLPPWKVGPARVRSGLAPILRVPLTCRRLPAVPGGEGFAVERKLLAASAGVPEADVALIGVFPHVPLGAVLKLSALSDGTALQVWVRPATGVRDGATVAVVLGRQRSTGRMLQTTRRGTAG